MNLSFSKISNNGTPINLKKDLIVPVDFNKTKNSFNATYKPLNLFVESKEGTHVIDMFTKEFATLYNQKESLDKKRQKHFDQIVK